MDIIQAVGRAIRLSPDKKAGTIVLPVFIATGEDAASTIEASNFKPIWDVLNALKAHDDVLACELDQIRTEMGRQTAKGVSAESLRKISIDLPATVSADFGGALRTYLVERITASWNYYFGLLETFVESEGHSRPPQDAKDGDGKPIKLPLGVWVASQRHKKDELAPERKALLEALPGWSWDLLNEKWEQGFHNLMQFAAREGHCLVPGRHITSDGYRLGSWINGQRTKQGNLSPERKARLEALPDWRWDARLEQWEEGFRYLKEFAEREGNCLVPGRHKTANGYLIGSWVNNQRNKKDNLSPECRARLESLPGWVWNVNLDKWEEGFRYLKEFADREGYATVPQEYKTEDGFRLGGWVSNQRNRQSSMPHDRQARLEALPGWVWRVKAES